MCFGSAVTLDGVSTELALAEPEFDPTGGSSDAGGDSDPGPDAGGPALGAWMVSGPPVVHAVALTSARQPHSPASLRRRLNHLAGPLAEIISRPLTRPAYGLLGVSGLEFLVDCGHHLVHVTDHCVCRLGHHRRLGVGIDRNDHLRRSTPGPMLNRSRNAAGHV